MNVNSSPHRVLSPRDAISKVPDAKEIVDLLMTKGQQMPTYDATSRESTPDIIADAKHWVDRIERLLKSISYLDNAFSHEEWRQDHIVDGRYWGIEADHWESYYADSVNDECKLDRSWQEEDLFRNQQARHDFCFFRDVNQLNWLPTYTRLTKIAAKPSPAAQDESPRLVFETIYHRYRARYWADLCQRRGYTRVREGIKALHYWQTEFGCIHDELLRLEKKSLDTESTLIQRARVSRRTGNTRIPAKGGDKKSNRLRAGCRKPTTAVNGATNVRRSIRLRSKRDLG